MTPRNGLIEMQWLQEPRGSKNIIMHFCPCTPTAKCSIAALQSWEVLPVGTDVHSARSICPNFCTSVCPPAFRSHSVPVEQQTLCRHTWEMRRSFLYENPGVAGRSGLWEEGRERTSFWSAMEIGSEPPFYLNISSASMSTGSRTLLFLLTSVSPKVSPLLHDLLNTGVAIQDSWRRWLLMKHVAFQIWAQSCGYLTASPATLQQWMCMDIQGCEYHPTLNVLVSCPS